MAHRKETPYQLSIVKGTVSFSGLWVYKDDHTDVRILGAIAKILPELFDLKAVEQVIRDEWHSEVKVASAQKAAQRVQPIVVNPNQGNPEEPYKFELPKWYEMRDGVSIGCIAPGKQIEDPVTHVMGGYRPERNPTFKKYTTRTMRPVVNFSTCIKCTLCWLQCPDSCFDVTPEGLYDANMEACCGCGVCEAVCPVEKCLTMVNRTEFPHNPTPHV